MSYDFGPASVGVMGTVDYVPVADIVNPLTDAIGSGEPSHLDLAHEVVYSVRGSLAIRLGSTNGMSR